MGKPRLIIIIRHAQSEGNKNRSIHQTTPDHRVKLTPHGLTQAEEAGQHLRQMLRPDDTLQFYTSPYRRTRETTEGILKSLTADEPTPSPFPRHTIKVYEEPRLREQDFGNFQPDSEAMERMWRERAEYGHFFYRIPNGESAADAYDRVSGFNETLWRSFSEEDFPSVCVLVTHGLMTRVFLMKWYHWSVEYFEDLRNVDHCEFVVMERTRDSAGKFILQNELRTWSELKRERARAAAEAARSEYGSMNAQLSPTSPIPVRRVWSAQDVGGSSEGYGASREGKPRPPVIRTRSTAKEEEDDEAFPKPKGLTTTSQANQQRPQRDSPLSLAARLREMEVGGVYRRHYPDYLEAGRDFGGSASGAPTPCTDTFAGKDGYFSNASERESQRLDGAGMHRGARADSLGDQRDDDDGFMRVERMEEDGSIEEMERRDKSVSGSVF